ncbi:MAG: hypothetical protein WCH43_01425 [Verrucomicrobiota bacterium]
MKIDIIYAACYKYDLRYTRILVASIRQWYPDIPICLIKDRFYGDFDTTEIEKIWGATVLKTEFTCYSWGFSKFTPLFLPAGQRFLVLDSDIVFTGPVLQLLESHDADFIVQREEPSPAFIESNYLNLEKLAELDPGFVFPGFTFNTGQWVGTSGLLSPADFEPELEWINRPRTRHPEVFKFGEQGLFNYVLMKKSACAEISLDRLQFMYVPGFEDCPPVRTTELGPSSSYRFVLHWCGQKRRYLSDMALSGVLLHFERLYYSRVPFGGVKRPLRVFTNHLKECLNRMFRKMVNRG